MEKRCPTPSPLEVRKSTNLWWGGEGPFHQKEQGRRCACVWWGWNTQQGLARAAEGGPAGNLRVWVWSYR